MFTHSVTCPHCGKSIKEDWKKYVIDSSPTDSNRGMGTEIEHLIECNEFECPHCGKIFNVSGSIWEYPENTYNTHELHTSK